ncbi:MAG: hypothetical protein IVW57_01135 [Ktedonobacterales bacterium]|nr:hypothetical protein [Ktedonobacterales bacterium]
MRHWHPTTGLSGSERGAERARQGPRAGLVTDPVGGRRAKPRRRRVARVLALVFGAVAVAGGVGYLVFAPQIGALLTARNFCLAVEHQQYTNAYGFFSPDLRQRVPLDAFTTISTRGDALQGRVTDCSASGVAVGDGRQSVIIQSVVTRSGSGQSRNDLHLLLLDGAWKIDEAPDPLLLPLTSAYAFCQDLKTQSYDAAFRLLSLATQTKLGNSVAFQAVLGASSIVTGGLKDCQVTAVALSANRQALTIQSTAIFERFPSLSTELDEVQNSPGEWRVDRLTLFILGATVRIPQGT